MTRYSMYFKFAMIEWEQQLFQATSYKRLHSDFECASVIRSAFFTRIFK